MFWHFLWSGCSNVILSDWPALPRFAKCFLFWHPTVSEFANISHKMKDPSPGIKSIVDIWIANSWRCWYSGGGVELDCGNSIPSGLCSPAAVRGSHLALKLKASKNFFRPKMLLRICHPKIFLGGPSLPQRSNHCSKAVPMWTPLSVKVSGGPDWGGRRGGGGGGVCEEQAGQGDGKQLLAEGGLQANPEWAGWADGHLEPKGPERAAFWAAEHQSYWGWWKPAQLQCVGTSFSSSFTSTSSTHSATQVLILPCDRLRGVQRCLRAKQRSRPDNGSWPLEDPGLEQQSVEDVGPNGRSSSWLWSQFGLGFHQLLLWTFRAWGEILHQWACQCNQSLNLCCKISGNISSTNLYINIYVINHLTSLIRWKPSGRISAPLLGSRQLCQGKVRWWWKLAKMDGYNKARPRWSYIPAQILISGLDVCQEEKFCYISRAYTCSPHFPHPPKFPETFPFYQLCLINCQTRIQAFQDKIRS